MAGSNKWVFEVMVGCVTRWTGPYSGGNMWGAWDCYLTAARDILGLQLPAHEKYAAWEQAAIHGGYRYIHPEFCMVSDFPRFIKMDDANRPHCDNGPSHQWRDGWSLFFWHGVSISDELSWIITNPEKISVALIDKEGNQEIKRVMLERFGVGRYITEGGATVLHRDVDKLGAPRVLYQKNIPGTEETLTMLHVKNSTPEPDGSIKDYFLEIHPECRPMWLSDKNEIEIGAPQEMTCLNAVASTFGLRGEDYNPQFES
jgi:hypothetical protein